MPRLLGAFGAGCLLALALPTPGQCWLAWIVPAILFRLFAGADRAPAWAALAGAFGLGYCGAALHWIYPTCRFAKVSVPVSLLAWGALSAFLASSWAVYGALAFRFRGLGRARPWAFAALWAGIEYAQAAWTPRLGADVLAYTQWRWPPMLQGASLLGPHALSFLIVAANAAIAEDWASPGWPRARPNALALIAAIGLWAGYGGISLGARTPSLERGRVEILQPNVDQYRKWDARFAREIRADIDALLSRPRPGPPDLVLWPEAALPGWLEQPAIRDWVAARAKELRAPMLVGTVSSTGGVSHNSAAFIGPDGGIAGMYHKRQLVPFGEFVPFRRWLAPHIGILSQLGDFAPGPREQPLFDTALGRTAASLCYEAAFPRWSRLDAGRGARVLVNLTNDAWYGDTWGPRQHFHLNVWRAVETRSFVLRAANTGISGVIDPYGRVLARTELGERTRLDVEPAVWDAFPGGSLYARTGDWFGPLCLLLSALLLIRRE